MKEKDVMDEKTLRTLIKEAKKALKSATQAFEEDDNCEDMHAMERWRAIVSWLESKLEGAQ